MLAILIMHLLCIFAPDHFADESFYPTIPLRLINGDSLVSDEWHLTQFSSLFLYLPTRLWLAITDSTEGIILYLRLLYLTIHTGISAWVYKHFREHGAPTVFAVLLFYSQVPLRFMSANYHSLLALFLLFLTVNLYTIATKEKKSLNYWVAGICYACCCVCNPFECFIYPIYILICILWHIKTKHSKNEKPHHKSKQHKAKQKQELQSRFFSKKAALSFSVGIGFIAIISILFFLLTGGKFSTLSENIPSLLTDGGHDIFRSPVQAFIEKISLTFTHINSISIGLPFLLPAFYLVLLFDKKRRNTGHLLTYIIIAFILTLFFVAGVLTGALKNSRCLAITLPLAILSTVCYILTQNKNKKLFYCVWFPSAIATIIQYLASDMHLSVMWTLVIGNLAGVFFISDFIKETQSLQPERKTKNNRIWHKVCAVLLCAGICLQLIFQCGVYMIGRTVDSDYVMLDKGPYKGLYMNQESYNTNINIMADLDEIKNRCDEDEPVLIISEFSWMYLYTERPFATYSAWQPFLESSRLISYYKKNPDKIPAYIYIGYYTIPGSVLNGHNYNPERAQNYVDSLNHFLDFDTEELSSGILLEVNERKLSY